MASPYVCNGCKKLTSRNVLIRFAGVCARCNKRHFWPGK